MINHIKSKLIYIFILICFLYGCNNISKEIPQVKEGVIDLTEWNFEKSGIIPLNGEWEFYWDQLYEPKDFELSNKPQPSSYFDVPNIWNGFKLNGKPLSGEGYATFKLVIEVSDPTLNYSLKIEELFTAYKLWVNGKVVASNGKVGTSKEAMHPQSLPLVTTFQPDSTSIQLVLQLSNYYHLKGGILFPIQFGLENIIRAKQRNLAALEMFLLGSFIIMFLYYLAIFFLRTKYRSALYLSIFCFLISLRLILVGEQFLMTRFPSFDWTLAVRLEFLTVYLSIVIFVAFIQSLYPQQFHKKLLNICIIIGVAFSLIVVFFPVDIFYVTWQFYRINLLLWSVYLIFVVTKAAINHQDGALILLMGIGVFFLATVNDILYYNQIINTGNFLSAGLFVFLFSQTFILAARFSKSFAKVEQLFERLELSSKNLKEVTDLNARMENELEIGKTIQMSMLPLIFPAFPKREEINIYAELIPAREVGGDFYDFYFIDENHLCFVMADVSGKGVPAALLMAVTKTLLKSKASNPKSTASILTDVNNELAKDNDTYMFITVFMAILNTNTGELVYTNAGHNPSYVITKENKEIIKLKDLHGPVLGAMEDIAYGETRLFLKKNDIIFSYTDGVTESHNIKAELYSDPRLEELLKTGGYDSSKTLVKLVIESVKEFEGEADQFDDITVMAIEYCQNPNTV